MYSNQTSVWCHAEYGASVQMADSRLQHVKAATSLTTHLIPASLNENICTNDLRSCQYDHPIAPMSTIVVNSSARHGWFEIIRGCGIGNSVTIRANARPADNQSVGRN